MSDNFLDNFNFEEDDFSLEAPELTETQVNDKFLELTREFEGETLVIEAAASLIEAESIVAKAEIEREELQTEANSLHEERLKMEKMLTEIKRKEAETRRKLWDVGSHQVQADKAVVAKKAAYDIAVQSITVKQEILATEQTYLERAKGKVWFEGYTDKSGTFKKILPHQWDGAMFLATAKRGLLGDGMGLGKTITSIAALDLVDAKRIMIVVPADLTSNFEGEIKEWAPHRNVVSIKGLTKDERRTVLNMVSMLDQFIIIVNYEIWRRDIALLRAFADISLDTVIVDEAHVMKNTASNAFEGVENFVMANNVCPQCPTHPVMPQVADVIKAGISNINKWRKCTACGWSGESFYAVNEQGRELNFEEKRWLSRSVKNMWCMTGTPILNSPVDIFTTLNLIDPVKFEDKSSFLKEYCSLDFNGKWKFRSGGQANLARRLRGVYLARTLADAGVILPPQNTIKHLLTVDEGRYPGQFRLIKMLEENAMIVLNSGVKLSNMAIIALITRQRQANVYPGGIVFKAVYDPETGELISPEIHVKEEVTESVKLDKAVELIQQYVADGERFSVFSQFTTALEELHDRLNGMTLDDGKVIRSVKMTGKTPDTLKDRIKANFNVAKHEEAEWDVVLCNYKTGGVGLNLTAARHMIILDREWNPGKENQAHKRNHRIGQTEETFVHELIVDGTIDEWLANLIESKQEMIEGFNEEATSMQAAYVEMMKNRKG